MTKINESHRQDGARPTNYQSNCTKMTNINENNRQNSAHLTVKCLSLIAVVAYSLHVLPIANINLANDFFE